MNLSKVPELKSTTELKRNALLLACGIAFTLALVASPHVVAQDKPQAPAAIFKPLRIGQKITMVDKGGAGVEIHLLNDGAIGSHAVIELGPSHIAVDDLPAISRTWIPTTSIRSVVWLRVREGAPAMPKLP
jgi:hypothetical protein